MFIEVSQRATTTCDPTQKTANHVEATPSAEPNKLLFNEARGVALHKLPVLPAPETLEQPAFAQVCFDFHLPMPPLLKAETQDGLCRTDYMPISVNHGENETVRHSSPGGINLPMPRAA